MRAEHHECDEAVTGLARERQGSPFPAPRQAHRRSLIRQRNTPTRTITRTVISLSLAGVVLGLTLTAILPAAYGQVINACVNTKTGALHILTSGTCKAGESPIS